MEERAAGSIDGHTEPIADTAGCCTALSCRLRFGCAADSVARVKKRASSIDVARLAGVSQSAVSRAYTPGTAVSDAMRARVFAAADTLNYMPNALASSLITRRTNMIALVTGDLLNPFYAKIVNAFSLAFQAAGLHVLLFSVSAADKVDAAVGEVLKYRVDGVMLTSATLSNDVAVACQRIGTPVVLYNRYSTSAAISAVRIENDSGGAAMADFFVDNGYRRIAFVAGTEVDETSADRERGFTARLAARGASLFARAAGDYSFESGGTVLRELWRAPERPDAIFFASDLMAFGAMDVARYELGLRLPDDLAVAGFDDLPMAAYPSYALTTIRQPVEAMAAAAVELLVAKIAHPLTVPRTILIPGALVVRGSAPART